MPYSSELGMRIYDPTEGQNYGLRLGQTFAEAFQQAQQNVLRKGQMAMDQQKLDMLKAEEARNARATQMKQLGMAELEDSLKNNISFKDAFFKAAPKLFSDNPQALGTIMHQEAADAATAAFRQKQLDQGERLMEQNRDHAENQFIKDFWSQKLDLLRLQRDKARDTESERHNKAMEAKPSAAAANRIPEGLKIRLESKLAELRSVNSEIAKFQTRNPIEIGKEPPREYMVLRNRQGRLQREIDALSQSQENPSTAAAPATAPKESLSPFKVGRFTITPE